MDYEEFLDAFRELYGQRPLTEGEFIGVLRQLQERQPLINYIETTVYEDIYRQLIKHNPVSLDRTIELANYLIHTNRKAIREDIRFYEELIETLNNNGESSIDSQRLGKLLKTQSNLNECLLKCLLSCFADVKSISVRKLGLLIEQLKVEMDGGGSLSFIGEYDIAKSLWADRSKIDRLAQSSAPPELSEQSSLDDIATDFFRKLTSLLQYIEYQATDAKLQQLAQSMRRKQTQFSALYENQNADRNNQLEYMRAAQKELDDQLFQQRAQYELLSAHTQKLEAEVEKLNKMVDDAREERMLLSRTIRQVNNELNHKVGEVAQLKMKVKGLVEDNELFRSTLQEITTSAMEIQSNNEHLKTLLNNNQKQEEQMLEDRTLKMELDDAYTKLNLLEEQLDEQRAKNSHYQRQLEQYQFRLEDLQLQLAARTITVTPPLGEEGVKQSYFMGSRIHQNMKSRILDNSRHSEVEVFNLGSSSMRPVKQSVMKQSVRQPSHLKPPDKSIIAFGKDSKINEIIQLNRSSLAVKLDLNQVPFTPPKLQPSPKPSPSRFAKKAEVPQIYIDISEQLYQHDYANMQEIDKVKQYMQKDKEDYDFNEQYLDRRFRLFSCASKLVQSDGTLDKVFVVITCTNLYILQQSKGKWQYKSAVRILNIRKLLLGDHSYLVVVRFGGESDYLLLMNRRKEFALFLRQTRLYIDKQDPLLIQKYQRNRDIVVIEKKKELDLSKFKFLFTPYTVCFQYYQFCSEVFLEFKRLLGGSEFKPVFLVVNYAGLHFLDDDQLDTKHDFKEKLILYLPVLPNLNLVEYGQKDDRLVKLKFEEGILQSYNVRCRSSSEKDDLVAQIRSIRMVMLQRRDDQQRQDKELLQYREMD